MAAIEFHRDAIENLSLPTRSLADGGPATLVTARARFAGLPIGPKLVLPFGERERERLRWAWLQTAAALLMPLFAVLAIVDLMHVLDGAGQTGFGWLGASVLVGGFIIAVFYVPQHPVVTRSGTVRIRHVHEHAARDWRERNPHA